MQQISTTIPEPSRVALTTDDLVDRFAAALKEKLRAAEEKYGRNDAWRADNWRAELIEHLHHHIAKGDPRDVAAYCAFAWHHQWTLQSPRNAASDTNHG